MSEPVRIYAIPFVTGEAPHCMWSAEPQSVNLRYLGSVDPTYFEQVAGNLRDCVSESDGQWAATALRATYGHAMETMFALLASAVQAPNCVIGWMTRYHTRDLYYFVRGVTEQRSIHSRIGNPLRWQTIAAKLFPASADERDLLALRTSFGDLWDRLAREFLDEDRQREFNSVKHGLRITPGGVSLTVRPERSPGIVDPAAPAFHFEGSKYGNTFYDLVPVTKGIKYNYQVRRTTRNYAPENLFCRLDLIAQSIRNVVTSLRHFGGDSECGLQWCGPENLEYFTECWKHRDSLGSGVESSWTDGVAIDERALWTKDHILGSYDART